MWRDMDPILPCKQVYMATLVSIISRSGLTIDVHCRNQPICNKSKPALYKPILSLQWPFKRVGHMQHNGALHDQL